MIKILLAAALAAVPVAVAEPSLAVTGLRQEPGFVEFYLSARDLPAGRRLDQVTVTAQGQPLTAVAMPVTTAPAEVPRRAVVLVVDTSGSTIGTPIKEAKDAALSFIAQLPPDVQVALVSGGAPAAVVQPLTGDRVALIGKIDTLAAQGETAVHDAMLSASDMMSAGEWGQRRIVALTGSADTASKADLEQTRRSVLAAKIPVDVIAFRATESAVDELSDLAEDSGGQIYTAGNAVALTNAFAKAVASFSTQLLVRVTVPKELTGSEAKLQISAAGLKTEVTVQLAVDIRAAGPLEGREAPRPPISSLLMSTGLIFGGLLLFGLMVVSIALNRAERRRRLAQVEQFTAPKRKRQIVTDPENTNQVTQAALAISAQMVRSANAESRIAQQLDRAGMRLRPHEWVLLRAVITLGLGLVLAILLHPFLGLLLGLLLGIGGTSLYHRHRATKRTNAFNALLPDALQLIIGSLRAGFSLSQAVDAMVRELPDPIASEFGRAVGETRLGVDLEDALDRMAARVGNKDLSWAVVAIRVQREVGGNLAEVLSNTVETIRDRESVRRHVQALSAEGRMSAWVLLGLPLVLGVFMFSFRSEYVRPLYTHPVGILMSLVGVTLVALGGFWLSRLVKIEV